MKKNTIFLFGFILFGSSQILRIAAAPQKYYQFTALWKKDSSINYLLRVVSKENTEEKEFIHYFSLSCADTDSNDIFDSWAIPFGFIQNRAGKELLLFVVNSGYDWVPRGIIAVAPESGRIMWDFQIGPQVFNPLMMDFDGDGFKEIVIGSYAPDNGLDYNGTRDDSSYIYLIDCEGQLHWRFTTGARYSGCQPFTGDFSGDGKPDLGVFYYNRDSKVIRQDAVMFLDPQTGQKRNIRLAGSFFKAIDSIFLYDIIADFNGDGIDEFVVGNTDGIVRMFDGDLKILKTSFLRVSFLSATSSSAAAPGAYYFLFWKARISRKKH